MVKWIIALAMLYFIGQCVSVAVEGNQGIVTTQLSAPLSASATVMQVQGTAGFPNAGRLHVGNEVIVYHSKTGSAFGDLERGINPQAHPTGRTVYSDAAGTINVGLDFQEVRSTAPVIGPVATLVNSAEWFGRFLFRAVLWDYSFFNGFLLGFPVIYFKYGIMYPLSIALLFVLGLAVRQMIFGR
jgi:hypothetical protein